MNKELVSQRRFKVGYVLKKERVTYPNCEPFEMTSAYNLKGEYVGNSRDAYHLYVKRGIHPECIPGNQVCSIGFCAKDQKWFGWSHRAIYGFGIGGTVKKGDCTAESLKIGFKAKSLNDAKKMAIAFARSVS